MNEQTPTCRLPDNMSRGDNQKGVSCFLVKWRYMKALNELFLLAKVLSFLSVHICIINN